MRITDDNINEPWRSDPDTDTDDTDRAQRHNINETADKVRVQVKVKRGEGTRDQDTHNIKVRADTPEEAADDVDAVIAALEERDVFARVREIGNDK
jgi:hypothetical protein